MRFTRRRVRFGLALVVSLAFLGGGDSTGLLAQFTQSPPQEAKFRAPARDGVPGQYFVVFTDAAAGLRGPSSRAQAVTADVSRAYPITRVHKVYSRSFNGFKAEMPEAIARLLSLDPRVRYVQQETILQPLAVQSDAPWHLDRLDQETGLDDEYRYASNNTGAGVTVYVMDTGVRWSHNEFGGRASFGADYTPDFTGQPPGPIEPIAGDDCNGHGTMVAALVGGVTFGVAKGVTIKSVKVVACGSGTTGGAIIDAIEEYIIPDHIQREGLSVLNISLGGPGDSTVDAAVEAAIEEGIVVVVAAGNNDVDAGDRTPARVADAITVAASNSSDVRASFDYPKRSNYGSVVDVFAPGQSVTSAWYSSDSATETDSGTSFAAPIVAGIAARYLQWNPWASPSTVESAIVNNATPDVLSDIGSGSPNRLASVEFLPIDDPGGGDECGAYNCLTADQWLDPDGWIESESQSYYLLYQMDGNLVLYEWGGPPVWWSGTVNTDPWVAYMQYDGNFVIYDDGESPIWATDTDGNPGAYLVLHDDGRLVLYDDDDEVLLVLFDPNA